jgi:hypothetical protein
VGVQIVGYVTAAGDADRASLLVGTDGDVEAVPLSPGCDLTYSLGERRCAGVLTDEGHRPCDASEAPYCPAHTSRWPCARCTGDCDRPLETCREEHAVYLAAFAPATFKVGVTRSWRLRERLREQGADRAAHLRTVADGRVARQVEAEIAAEVGDRVRVPTKTAGLHRSVDDDAWADLLAGFEPVETVEFAYDLCLADRPVRETLATGEVRGTKGRVLVLERGGSTYAVDMRDLVGYGVRPEETDRRLQSSLGAFG